MKRLPLVDKLMIWLIGVLFLLILIPQRCSRYFSDAETYYIQEIDLYITIQPQEDCENFKIYFSKNRNNFGEDYIIVNHRYLNFPSIGILLHTDKLDTIRIFNQTLNSHDLIAVGKNMSYKVDITTTDAKLLDEWCDSIKTSVGRPFVCLRIDDFMANIYYFNGYSNKYKELPLVRRDWNVPWVKAKEIYPENYYMDSIEEEERKFLEKQHAMVKFKRP